MSAVFDFSVFPVLTTPRLRLRQLCPEDAPAILRLRGDEQVTRFNTGVTYDRLEQAENLLEALTRAYQSGEEIRWGITLREGDDQVIGMCGYNYWIQRDRRASIGYDLARAYWNKGYMTEAISAVVRFGFERMDLNRIEADADVRNPASWRVLEKVGFVREGLQREQFFDGGAFYDLMLFSLLRHDYQSRFISE